MHHSPDFLSASGSSTDPFPASFVACARRQWVPSPLWAQVAFDVEVEGTGRWPAALAGPFDRLAALFPCAAAFCAPVDELDPARLPEGRSASSLEWDPRTRVLPM